MCLRTTLLVILAIAAVMSVVATALTAKPAEATHYRSAQLSWEKGSSSNQAIFKSTIGLRHSFYGNPAVGSTVYDGVNFGDGSSANVAHKVVLVDQANDWMLVEGTTSHTYAAAGPYTASVDTCCRLSGPSHINNPDGNFTLRAKVDFAATMASPESSISPIVDCQKNATCNFVVPATDADGQGISYRLATSSDGFNNQPIGATIDSNSGVYSWNTTGATLAPSGYDTYYSTQVVIQNLDSNGNVVAKTPVDFFIRLTDTASTNNAPEFDLPTPADGKIFDTEVGSEVAFDVAAHDDDSGDQVTLNVANKPSGATFITTAANPASGRFSWTPSSTGSTILTITAQDQKGLGATQRSVTINAKVINKPPTANAGGPYAVDEGGTVSLDASGSSDSDGTIVAYAWDLDGDGQYDDSTDKTPAFSAANLDGPSKRTVGLEVTDDKGSKSTTAATADVNVRNVAPTATSFVAPASVDEGGKIDLSLTNASDPAGSADTLTYAFDCDGDGTYGAPGVTSTDSCSATDNGVRTVKAKVNDEDGGETEYTANLTVNNVAPALTDLSLTGNKDIACQSSANTVGLSFAFDDPAKANDTYTGTIDWGDGSPAASFGGSFNVNESHDYKPGAYTITVNVQDEDGGKAAQKEGQVTRQYQVSKLLAPVNADGSSVFKHGSTIPLKVKITDCGNNPVSGLAPSVRFTKTSTTTPQVDANEGTSTSSANDDFVMRWSSDSQTYIYNLGTKSLVDGDATYAAIVQDGTTAKAFGPTTSQNFGLRTK